MRRVYLKNPSQLPLAVKQLGLALNKGTINALVKAARFGHTAVIRTASRTSPKPQASQNYRQAWVVQKTKHGAILGNSARSSYFVEVGRRPGRMPPWSNPADGLLLWVKLKRLTFGGPKPKKPGKPKKLKKQTPAAAKVAKVKAKAGVKKPPSKAAISREKLQRRLAFLVARKISRTGTPGRYVLARTMPKIRKYAIKETRIALKKITGKGGK